MTNQLRSQTLNSLFYLLHSRFCNQKMFFLPPLLLLFSLSGCPSCLYHRETVKGTDEDISEIEIEEKLRNMEGLT